MSGSGDGHDADHPILVANGLFSFGANVQTSRALKNLELQIDGATLAGFQNGEKQGSVVTLNVVGDHVLEALAVDDLGATGRAGTGVIYIRIVPAPSSATAERAGPDSNAAAAATGKVFKIVNSGGHWDDASTWRDFHGDPGIPGADDFVIIGASTVHIGSVENVSSLSLGGGHIVGPGTLQIYGTMFISGGSCDSFVHLIIKSGAVCQLLNNVDFHLNGLLDNRGTVNVHGSAGLTGADQILNLGTVNFQTPLTPPLAAATDPAALVRMIDGIPSNAGLITGSITSLLTSDGASLITSDGAGVVSNDGGSLVATAGGALIGDDGSGLLSEGGLGLLSERGTGLIGQRRRGLYQRQRRGQSRREHFNQC